MFKLKNYAFIILAFVFSLTFVKTSFAGNWVADGGYWFYNESGTFVVSDWREIDKVNYYFDEQGHMATSLARIGKKYFLFHSNGKPYNKDEQVVLNNKTYDIGARGKVIDLEYDIDDTTYFKILTELKAKKAEEEAFLATSYDSPDLVPENVTIAPAEITGEMTEQEQRLAAAEEYNRKEREKAAAEALAAKYRILSKEYRDELINTANTAGTDYNTAADALMAVFTKQLNSIKTIYCNNVLTIMQTAPETLNIDSILSEYEKTLKEYEPEIDAACLAIKTKFTMANTPYVLMKDKFTTLLGAEKKTLRDQIINLAK